MNAPEDQNGLREALARAEPLTAEEMAEIEAADPFRQPPPPPIPVRDRYYLVECEHCGWVGSSEQCGNGGAPDYDDIICAGCHQSILGDGPNEADTAKHGQAVFDRITSAEARARAAEAELDDERQESARLALAVTEGQAEIARLKEAVAGLLPRKLCGEISTTPNEERVQITVTFGAIRLGRQALATLSPKEQT